jgi:hypothetical protein
MTRAPALRPAAEAPACVTGDSLEGGPPRVATQRGRKRFSQSQLGIGLAIGADVAAPARVDAVELRIEALEAHVLAEQVVAAGSVRGFLDRLHLNALRNTVQIPPFVLGAECDDDFVHRGESTGNG